MAQIPVLVESTQLFMAARGHAWRMKMSVRGRLGDVGLCWCQQARTQLDAGASGTP
jgi:hypothetical protein